MNSSTYGCSRQQDCPFELSSRVEQAITLIVVYFKEDRLKPLMLVIKSPLLACSYGVSMIRMFESTHMRLRRSAYFSLLWRSFEVWRGMGPDMAGSIEAHQIPTLVPSSTSPPLSLLQSSTSPSQILKSLHFCRIIELLAIRMSKGRQIC